ncbi:MAG TPA: hypothetical protein PKY81_15380 [bacterium]|nr:hypothetical protein [bacterium]
MKIPENQNLNNFIFYSNNDDAEIFRKNIIRAFAVCLRYDLELLHTIFKISCSNKKLAAYIDSKKNKDIEEIELERYYMFDNEISNIIGISITQADCQVLKNQLKIIHRKNVDLSIKIGKVLILFFIDTDVLPKDYQKRFNKYIKNLDAYNREYNSKYKSEIVKNITHKVLDWKTLFVIIEQRIKNYEKDNDKTKRLNDFMIYLQSNLWHLFPQKLLKNIEFTMSDDLDCNYNISDRLAYAEICNRLYYIKKNLNIGTLEKKFDGISKMPEIVISSDCGMFEKIKIETALMKDEFDLHPNDCLSISMTIGKNVEEAENFFNKNKNDFKFPELINGYKMNVYPYVFVYKRGGSHKKTRIDNNITEFYLLKNQFTEIQKSCADLKWKNCNHSNEVSGIISETVDKNIYWRYDTDWNDLVKEDCCNVKISIGYAINIFLPYEKVLKLDDDIDNPKLIEELRNTILEFYKVINADVEKDLNSKTL